MNLNGTVAHEELEPVVNYSRSTIVKVKDVAALRAHWPWVEKRLLKIRHRDKASESWQPAHIREAIMRGFAGNATVELFFFVDSEDALEGFAITTVYVDPYTQLPDSLVIWLGWGTAGLIKHHMAFFERMGRERFLNRIEFISGRRGWSRKKAVAIGFTVKATVYSKDLRNGF